MVDLKLEVKEVLLGLQKLRVNQQVFGGFQVQIELNSLRVLPIRVMF